MNEREQAAGLAPTPGYRYARRSGEQLYVAGQVPLNGDGELVSPAKAAPQATQCLRNLEVLLSCHGFACADIHHLTVYVVGSRAQMTAAWHSVCEYFDGQVPPATLLGVALLGYDDQVVEIDATVARLKPGAA